MPDIKHIYTQALENTHAAEAQGLAQMKLQVDGLGDYSDYQSLLRRHIATTERQLSQIERALQEIGAGKPTLREAVTGAVGAVGTAVHAVMPDATLKNLFAGHAFQGEMIAAYTSLAVIAKAAGFEAHVDWIKANIDEEKDAARQVEAIVPSVTAAFLEKTAS